MSNLLAKGSSFPHQKPRPCSQCGTVTQFADSRQLCPTCESVPPEWWGATERAAEAWYKGIDSGAGR